VFKWTTRHLAALEPITLTRQHSFGHVSIRRIHPGAHRIDIQINGHVLATTEIDVTATT
jgi:hypothetical protein